MNINLAYDCRKTVLKQDLQNSFEFAKSFYRKYCNIHNIQFTTIAKEVTNGVIGDKLKVPVFGFECDINNIFDTIQNNIVENKIDLVIYVSNGYDFEINLDKLTKKINEIKKTNTKFIYIKTNPTCSNIECLNSFKYFDNLNVSNIYELDLLLND